MGRLKAEAKRRGVPVAELVRDVVDRAIPDTASERRAAHERAMSVAGRFHSGTGDVSARHDEIATGSNW
jgi:hypothetical protein